MVYDTYLENGFGLKAAVLQFLDEENRSLEQQEQDVSLMKDAPRPHQTKVILPNHKDSSHRVQCMVVELLHILPSLSLPSPLST